MIVYYEPGDVVISFDTMVGERGNEVINSAVTDKVKVV